MKPCQKTDSSKRAVQELQREEGGEGIGAAYEGSAEVSRGTASLSLVYCEPLCRFVSDPET